MNLILIESLYDASPAVEPVTVAEAKQQVRAAADVTDEDDLLTGYIRAAREQVEDVETWTQLLTATYELRLDKFPGSKDVIRIPRPPLQSILSVKYIDADGVEQTFYDATVSPITGADKLVIDAKSKHVPERGGIWLSFGEVWPTTRNERNAVRVRFKCGYGDNASDVPQGVRNYIKLLAATMFEHRETESRTFGTIPKLQFVDGLLDRWRAKEWA